MARQTVTVSVLADTRPMAKAFGGLSQKLGLGKIGTAVKGLGKAALAGGAVAATGLGAMALAGVRAASDLEQSMGGVDAVFKSNSDQVHQLAADAAMNLGLTGNSYNELATIIGTTLKASGTPMKELAGETDKLITRSADLAATFGGPVTQASGAMASALRGEFEPLRQYGVSLNQADINARALADTNKASTAELTKQDKALATQALIMEQSTDAAGAFARENDTLAGKLERAKATAGNLAAEFGQVFLPAATAAMGYLLEKGVPALQELGTWAGENLLPKLQALGAWFQDEGVPRLQAFGDFLTTTVVPKLQELGAWFQDEGLPRLQAFGDFLATTVVPKLQELGEFLTGTVVPKLQELGTWVQNNTTWLGPLAAAIAGAVAGWKLWTMAVAAHKAITTAWAATVALATKVQKGLNVAMRANVFGIVITIVLALVAAITYLWTTNEGFRTAVLNAWAAIKRGVSAAWSWLSTLPSKFTRMMATIRTRVSSGISAVVGFFRGLPGKAAAAVSSLASRIGAKATQAMTDLRTKIRSGLDRAITLLRGLPSRAVRAVGNLGSKLAGAGRQLIQGFINSITAGFRRVRDKLRGLTNLLPSWKGPAKKDRQLLKRPGQLIIQSLIDGLAVAPVRRHLGRLTRDIARTDMPTLTAGLDVAPATDGRGRLAARGSLAGHRTYEVHVHTLEATPEVGRLVVQSIRDYERLNGAPA